MPELNTRPAIAERLLAWFDRAGRHTLPWKTPRDPYRIWVSEIMLQQTQVTTVVPYFERFMMRFPHVQALAEAPADEVLQHWTGLGYYARARNLHRAAQRLTEDHNGMLPADPEALQSLPGIGRSTAGAIAAMAFDVRAPILDGNVRRVLARYHGIRSWPGERRIEQLLWRQAEQHTPESRVADFTQAIMDLGATVCRRSRPDCTQCPLASDCLALAWQQTHAIPAPRPRKERPTRHRTALLLFDRQGRILLEQRPPQGIWGGLWSFPEFETSASAAEHARDLGEVLPAEALNPSAVLVHLFTHYRLELTLLATQLTSTPAARVSERPIGWFAPDGPLDIALAAPVKRTLQQGLLAPPQTDKHGA